ncbi:flagellar biosynthesis protein FlhF [Solimonas variicoloris]|uniref:flagellar biosynthesis protein FlhF n=1 Tax=Solimonas variicoloris TaxID=254408 RepID=UPI000376A32F|nr:flagellar biosynthesis protein FlhF [Solimonas variicoloris]
MKIKRFLAKNMREAIRLVREELGPEAVILSNHRAGDGIEVVAATDYDAALMQQAVRRAAPPPEPPSSPAPAPMTPSGGGHDPLPAPAPPPSPELQQLRRELGGMRKLLESQMAGMAWRELREHPQRLRALQTMIQLGVEPTLAREIAAELPEASDDERARFLPLGLLTRRLPVVRDDVLLDGGVIALVGPTGAGKTTTLAKLAARYAERHGTRDLALVTTDHFRVGAQEQLFTYGRLLGVPVQTAAGPDELRAVLARLSDRKLVLIDTAGVGPRDAQLQAQLAVKGHGVQNWLVLSATTQAADLDAVIRRYAPTAPNACVLTKLDETLRIGGVLSATVRHHLPIAYCCDGQRVPEDLELARANALVLRAMQLARTTPARVDDATLALQFGAIHAAQ